MAVSRISLERLASVVVERCACVTHTGLCPTAEGGQPYALTSGDSEPSPVGVPSW